MRALVAGLCLAAATAPPAGGETLRVGVAPIFPPFIEPSNRAPGWTGLDAEVMGALCEDLGLDCRWETRPVAELLPALQAGELDVVMGGLGVSAAREAMIDFLCPHWQVEGPVGYLWVADPSLTLETARIGTTRGTLFEEALARDEIPARLYATLDEALTAIAAGEIDAVLWGGRAGELAAGRGITLSYLDYIETPSGGVALAVSEDAPDLRRRLNDGLAALSASGRLGDMQWRWMGADQGDVVADCRSGFEMS